MLAGGDIDILGIAIAVAIIAAVAFTWWLSGNQDWRDALVDEEMAVDRETRRGGGTAADRTKDDVRTHRSRGV